MPKWEYLVFITDSTHRKVIKVNDQKVGTDYFVTAKGAKLYEFLNEMGQAGWELVTYDEREGRGILKRPKGDQ